MRTCMIFYPPSRFAIYLKTNKLLQKAVIELIDKLDFHTGMGWKKERKYIDQSTLLSFKMYRLKYTHTTESNGENCVLIIHSFRFSKTLCRN